MRTLSIGDIEVLQQAQMRGIARIARVIRSPAELATRPFLNGASPDMNVNGSVTPVAFRYTALEPTLITRIQGVIMDTDIEPNKFGGLAELTNGINIHAHKANGNLISDLSGPIKANWQFSVFSTVQTQITIGSTEDLFEFGIDLAAAGTTMFLNTGQYLDVNINDDLTGLTAMRIAALGYKLNSAVPDMDEG